MSDLDGLDGTRLMLWHKSNGLSSLHAEREDCKDEDHCGGPCQFSGYVMRKESSDA